MTLVLILVLTAPLSYSAAEQPLVLATFNALARPVRYVFDRLGHVRLLAGLRSQP